MSSFKKVERKNIPIKIALEGPSGSGKTYSALLLARGLTTSWDRVAFLDTENDSGSYYQHLGDYLHFNLEQPHSPQRYIAMIDEAEKNPDIDVLVIDSITHEWIFCLQMVSAMQGNSFTAWKKVTPLHDSFMMKILHSRIHLISCMRSKEDYVLEENDRGKQVPKKVGLKSVQRDGVNYEFGVVFDIGINHYAEANKDRTGIFGNAGPFIITEETGKNLLQWADSGMYVASNDQKLDLKKRCEALGIKEIDTIKDISDGLLHKPMNHIDKLIKELMENNKSGPKKDKPAEGKSLGEIPKNTVPREVKK